MAKLIGAAAVGAAAYATVYLYLTKRKKTGKITMGYWGIRGLGAPLRMMLEYAGAEYEDVQYTEPGPWFAEKKPELLKKNALANLPFLEMPDGTVVAESNACYVALAEHLGMSGGLKDLQLLCLCMCTRNDMTNRCYDKSKCPDKAAFDASMAKLLESGLFDKYEASLALSGTKFFCGDAPSACDFHIFEMMDQFTKLASALSLPPPLAKLPLSAAFHSNVKALPTLQKYFASDIYLNAPVNAPGIAHWW